MAESPPNGAPPRAPAAPAPRAKWWGAPVDPPCGLTFGDSGLTKTTDTVAAFPTFLFVCQPGALRSAYTYLGLDLLPAGTIKERRARSLGEVVEYMHLAQRKGVQGVAPDDLSLIATDTEQELEFKERWSTMAGHVSEIRKASRWLGIGFWTTAHEQTPYVDKKTGALLPGGPRFPMKPLTQEIPPQVDTVLRVVEDAARHGRTRQARASYECGTPNYWTKDRNSAAPASGPANLRALLTFAGYVLPRCAGLGWQDQVMQTVADRLTDGGDREAVVRAMHEKLVKELNKHTKHASWAIRDGVALAEIRRLRDDFTLEDLFGGAPLPGMSLGNGAPLADGENDL